jgi:hypothetical protein
MGAPGWTVGFSAAATRYRPVDGQARARHAACLKPSQAGDHELPEHFGGLGIVRAHLGVCMLVACHASDDGAALCVPSEHRLEFRTTRSR